MTAPINASTEPIADKPDPGPTYALTTPEVKVKKMATTKRVIKDINKPLILILINFYEQAIHIPVCKTHGA